MQLIDAQGQLNALHRDNPRLQHNSVLQRAKQKHDLHKGDAVLVKSYGQYGELLSKRGNHKWEVQIGILKMEIDENNLEKVAKKDLPREKRERGFSFRCNCGFFGYFLVMLFFGCLLKQLRRFSINATYSVQNFHCFLCRHCKEFANTYFPIYIFFCS